METKFNFKSAICTDRNQSERLLSLGLKKETADCYLFEYEKGKYKVIVESWLDLIADEKYYSQYYYVYLSENGSFEYPANYFDIFVLDKKQVINNYVYQLSLEYPNYYYLDTTGTLKQEPYASSSAAATFSSYDKAYQYVYVRELMDLYGKKITATEANYLNSGTVGTHRKAEGEETIAQEGQIWIRYKRAKWDYIDKESSWVWYCYDSSTNNTDDFTIDTTVGILPDLLAEALTKVSTKITQNGKYLYLVGADHTDKYGAPKLHDNQIHRFMCRYWWRTFGLGTRWI